MNTFVNAMKSANNETHTENGAFALKSTNNSIVDLFGSIGSLRSRDFSEIETLFSNAFAEDALLATKLSFYARNVRGGLGERRTARCIWSYLASVNPEIMRKNLRFVPYFGRWDDLYCFVGTPVENDMWDLMRCQYIADKEVLDSGVGMLSLMSKWVAGINSANANTKRLAWATAKALKLSPQDYRKIFGAMRNRLDIVETHLSSKDYNINYSGVTSKAMTRYRNAFARVDSDGFQEYLTSLEQGKSKINASTLYPYDILEAYSIHEAYNSIGCGAFDTVLEEQWKALPNYVDGEHNILIMADTSGSMRGRPLATSIGLAMYFAERNTGAFKDIFMTFSQEPEFVSLKGSTLRDRLCFIQPIVSNTNIEAAFKEILRVSVKNNVPPTDMPKALVIISDMEFDVAVDAKNKELSYYTIMKEMFEANGYTLPNIIFWNVNSSNEVFHVVGDKPGVQLASGQSTATFKSILANIGKTPYQAVVDTLNTEMYSCITV